MAPFLGDSSRGQKAVATGVWGGQEGVGGGLASSTRPGVCVTERASQMCPRHSVSTYTLSDEHCLSSATPCTSFSGRRARNLHPNLPKEPLPVEGVEKVVGQALRPHQVVQHGPWGQAAEGEGTSASAPGLPRGHVARACRCTAAVHEGCTGPPETPGTRLCGLGPRQAARPEGRLCSPHRASFRPVSTLSIRGASTPGVSRRNISGRSHTCGQRAVGQLLRKPHADPPRWVFLSPSSRLPQGTRLHFTWRKNKSNSPTAPSSARRNEWRSPAVLEGMGSACSALTTTPVSSSANGGQCVPPQVGVRTGAVPGTWRVFCERGVKGRTHRQRRPCQPASP